MKKIVLLVTAVVISASVSAQEPEKKKDSKTTNGSSQERSINESGISVKSKPHTKTSAKEVQPSSPTTKDKKVTEQQPKAVNKPD